MRRETESGEILREYDTHVPRVWSGKKWRDEQAQVGSCWLSYVRAGHNEVRDEICNGRLSLTALKALSSAKEKKNWRIEIIQSEAEKGNRFKPQYNN